MTRNSLLLVLLLPLTACQGNGFHRATAATAGAAPTDNFDRNTVQTYNIQTRDFEEKPPFGARSLQDQ